MKRANFHFAALASLALLVALSAACGDDGGSAIDGGLVADDGGTLGADFVFDESVIRSFNLTLPDAEWQALNDNAQAEQYVSANVEYGGQTLENIGLRFKGSYGSLFFCFQGNVRICDKLSLKLKFNEFVPGQLLFGLKRVNLHSMNSDPSKMHDAIGYKLFRDQGVYAPRTAYARILVNGESLGLYAVVEAIDGRFARANFPDGGEGNVYKEVWPEHDTEGPYINALKTNEDANPSADKMLRFAQALSAAGDDGFVATLQAWTDVDMLMKYMAVDRLIDHWDGIVGWYCTGLPVSCFNHNFYWYESTAEDKIWLVPWDMDHTFEEPSPIRTTYGMPDWDDMNASCTSLPIFAGIRGRPPACDSFIGRMARLLWDDYVAATNLLLTGDFSQASMDARIDQLAALIAAEVEADTLSTQTSEQWRAAVNQLKSSVAAKRAYIQSKL